MVTLDPRAVTNRLRQLGLLENPFLSYPDARYFVPCIEHTTLYQEILQLCVGDPEQRVALVRGGFGTGKTTLTTRLAQSIIPGSSVLLSAVLVSEEVPTQTTFVRAVNDTFGLETRRSLEERLEVLRDYVLAQQGRGSGLLIIVDGNLSSQVWSTLLDILSWKQAGELLNVRASVFSENNLFKYEESKKQLKGFVGVRSTLGNLSFASATKILETRPKMAGRSAPLFQPAAAAEIVEWSNGHPGKLIGLAGRAFEMLLDSNEMAVSLQMVVEARKLKPDKESAITVE
jgi:type II secretory pathway predicted ATPase ExeA